MHFQRYLFLFLRNSWIMVLLVAAGLGGAWAWLSQQTPIYASRAALEVEDSTINPLGDKVGTIQNERYTGLDSLNTDVQAMTGNAVMLATAEATGLTAEWASKDPTGKVSAVMESSLAATTRSQLTVSLRRGTRIIDVVAEDADPEKARLVADTVLSEFLKAKQQAKVDDIAKMKSPLQKEVERLKLKLDEAEKAIADWPSKNDAISAEESQMLLNTRIRDLDKQAAESKVRIAVLETDLATLQRTDPKDVEAMLKLESVNTLTEVAALRLEITKQQSAFEALKERYGPKHPKFIAAHAQLQDLDGKLHAAVGKAGDSLQQQFKTLQENRDKVEKMLANENQALLVLNKKLIPYNLMKEQLKADRDIYASLLTSNKEMEINPDLLKNKYRIIEPALVNPLPVRPNRTKTLAIAGLLALALGVGIILLIDRLDASIRTVDQAESELELPVLAAIPECKDLKESSVPVLESDPGSSQSEAFRSLRAALSLLGEETNRRLLLVTSAVPSEGKTFTSLNLAAALAGQGLRTLLIDADLRRPMLSACFLSRDIRSEEDYRGLSDVLSGLEEPKGAIRSTETEGLSLLPSGRRPPNPSELLAQPRLPKLLASLLADYDRIILDTAPIHAVSDTLYLSPHAHAVCLVLRFGKTPRRIIQRAIELLQKSGARMAGIVMNRLPVGRGASYYYYYYGDPYVKDSVYGSDSRKGKGGGDKRRRRRSSGTTTSPVKPAEPNPATARLKTEPEA
ncbi:MAG: polysaccharide biosynthesis tyrosine autokinase [Verrucomicrobiales bacterium]|nr:polysaccharide biosynthesis tyrosine autokinase [Verrucomicrobiales bacterium]